MNLIRNEDDTFDINVTEQELAHIAIWSCIDGEHYQSYLENILSGLYSNGIRQIVAEIDRRGNNGLHGIAQSETHQRLARELLRLVEEGDIDDVD